MIFYRGLLVDRHTVKVVDGLGHVYLFVFWLLFFFWPSCNSLLCGVGWFVYIISLLTNQRLGGDALRIMVNRISTYARYSLSVPLYFIPETPELEKGLYKKRRDRVLESQSTYLVAKHELVGFVCIYEGFLIFSIHTQ